MKINEIEKYTEWLLNNCLTWYGKYQGVYACWWSFHKDAERLWNGVNDSNMKRYTSAEILGIYMQLQEGTIIP